MSNLLVAGLGNPGREYAGTRHNLGWWVIDALASREQLTWKRETRFQADVARWDGLAGRTCWFLKPTTFMNESGRSLRAFADFHRVAVESVIVVYDDVGIDLGLVKVSVTGSPGGHNGIASVLEHLGTGFVRYRLGIGPRQPPTQDLKDFVLARFTPGEQQSLEQNLESLYLHGLRLLLEKGADAAMNSLNRRNQNEPEQT